jgi:hypothetical protein
MQAVPLKGGKQMIKEPNLGRGATKNKENREQFLRRCAALSKSGLTSLGLLLLIALYILWSAFYLIFFCMARKLCMVTENDAKSQYFVERRT